MSPYGAMHLSGREWVITRLAPHVSIRLKRMFPRIPVWAIPPISISSDKPHCADLTWFLERYPLDMCPSDREVLQARNAAFWEDQASLEKILLPSYIPSASPPGLNPGQIIRTYQGQAIDLAYMRKALLLGDRVGLGKTYSALGFCLLPGVLPAAIAVQTHLQQQWMDKMAEFTSLRGHKIKKTTPYDLPEADIYIFKYSQLAGWVDRFRPPEPGSECFFKTAIYDEIQELRRGTASQKGIGAQVLSENVIFKMGLSATPIYNYGNEIYEVIRYLDETILGSRDEFTREWLKDHRIVNDPDALGSYLKEQKIYLGRTKKDVGQQMPPVNVILEMVDTDESELEKVEDLAKKLARKSLTGSFTERGMAARELDMLVRQATGIAKARHAAAYIKMLLECGETVLVAAWHREVYRILEEELKDFKPLYYTGSESDRQKDENKKAFIDGTSKLMFISLRSGAGLDGLQSVCSTLVVAEMDWSPFVHEQLIGRLDRDGQEEQVTAIFLASYYGSDPLMIEVLGLKSSQAHGIMNPGVAPIATHTDPGRLKTLARQFLSKKELAEIDALAGSDGDTAVLQSALFE